MKRFASSKKLRSQRLSESYYDLLDSARRSNSGMIRPSELKMNVSNKARQFSGSEQHDAQELLRFLLEGMHDELNQVTSKPPYQKINCDDKPIYQ